ncbi:MAG: EAL domain-containing protein, partial [Clostridia bacterium]|nr:EAL domain-containing protein [Clostridia bacterium]
TELRSNPDISAVILDLIMPELDGYGVLTEMKKDRSLSHIPVIVVTASDDDESQVKALDLGALDVLIKPFSAKVTLRRIATILERQETLWAAEYSAQQKELLYLARHDPLTGLLNRITFIQEAQKLIRQRPANGYIICCLDIDNFKVVNDRFGHEAGDQLLKMVANAIGEAAELIGGVACRDMADTFFGIFRNDLAALNQQTNVFFQQISAYDLPMRIDVHLGCYLIDRPEMDVNQMIDRALLAVRSIKRQANEHIAWFDDEMRRQILRRQELEDKMRAALENGEFTVYFQPQYDYMDNSVIGAEALVRWLDPETGPIAPSEFIPLCEDNGFISELDKFVWETTCQYLRRWTDAGLDPVPASVNISQRDFINLDLVSVLSGLVEKHRLKPSQLHLEITESAYVNGPEQLIQVVRELQKRGFIVEMDDFGSGYSSLNTLKEVPVNTLKMDMKFVEEGADDFKSKRILSSVVRMANWIELPVIAEGVETREQADFLKSLGCYRMQGYYFAKPMPAGEYEKILAGVMHGEKLVEEREETEGVLDFLSASNQTTLMFNSFIGGALILEFDGGNIEVIRVNDRFFEVVGGTRAHYARWFRNTLELFAPPSRGRLVEALQDALRTGAESSCELELRPFGPGEAPVWLMTRVRFLTRN